ncbi:MAG TPA: hypothetical protein VFG52_10785, partial [Xanthomonadales bacterium]|nr:hypothetical protein [Xanthomonadales bacterium]
MKFYRAIALAGAMTFAIAESAFAVPTITIDQEVVPATQTSVVVTVAWQEGGGVNTTFSGSFNVTYNAAALSSNASSVCNAAPPPGQWGCSENVAGTIVFVSPFVPSNLPDFLIDITFDLTGATAPNTYPLTVTNPNYNPPPDGDDTPIPGGNITNGFIQILPPVAVADFNPNAGPLNLGSAPQSGTNPSTVVTIDNIGPTGSLLDASCSITSNPGVFSVTNGSVNDLTAAATPHEVTVSCNSGSAVQVHNGAMQCTHDGGVGSDASPLNYSLTCEITAGPTPKYGSVPAPGGTVSFGQPVKDTAPVPMNVEINNDAGDVGAVDLSSSGCTLTNNPNNAYSITAGSGAFTIATAGPHRIVTVQCDTSIVGNHAGGVLSCPHNGSNTPSPATYTLNCEVLP